MNGKKLYKSETDKKVCGVCGGIGQYFNIDSTIVRLLFLLMMFGWGSGLVVYIVAACVMPVEGSYSQQEPRQEPPEYSRPTAATYQQPTAPSQPAYQRQATPQQPTVQPQQPVEPWDMPADKNEPGTL